ncbi:MAG TPA: DUF3822 family protein [Bacteroidales bacterium]|nr:DUF3822 family protein [Bacteroidales bacterium]
MHERELFDETLDINSTNNYEISIQVSLNGFSFSLLDTFRKRFVMLREYKLNGREAELSTQLSDIAGKDDFLGKSYRKYRVIFSFEKSTLIPSSLYDPALKDEYFTLNHSLSAESVVSNNKLTEPDAYLLFDLRQDLLDTTCRLFPEATLSHQARPLLFDSFIGARKLSSRYIRVNIEDTYFNITIIKERNLEFFNTFRYRNSSDILYYLLNTLEHLGVNKQEPVYLSGNIMKFDELYNNMLKYIMTLKFASPVGDFSVSYIFDEIGVHRYSNLFNIVSCA